MFSEGVLVLKKNLLFKIKITDFSFSSSTMKAYFNLLLKGEVQLKV